MNEWRNPHRILLSPGQLGKTPSLFQGAGWFRIWEVQRNGFHRALWKRTNHFLYWLPSAVKSVFLYLLSLAYSAGKCLPLLYKRIKYFSEFLASSKISISYTLWMQFSPEQRAGKTLIHQLNPVRPYCQGRSGSPSLCWSPTKKSEPSVTWRFTWMQLAEGGFTSSTSQCHPCCEKLRSSMWMNVLDSHHKRWNLLRLYG